MLASDRLLIAVGNAQLAMMLDAGIVVVGEMIGALITGYVHDREKEIVMLFKMSVVIA